MSKLDEAILALKYSNDIAGAIKLIQAHKEEDTELENCPNCNNCISDLRKEVSKLRQNCEMYKSALEQIAAWDIGVTPCTKEKVIYVAKKALEGR